MASQVAFLGPEGSFTHQAATKAFGDAQHVLSVQSTFEDIFLAVQSGAIGVVPIENSSNGPVTQTLSLLGNYRGRFADVQIVGEVFLPVEHYLLGHAPANTQQSSSSSTSAGTTGGILQGEPLYDLSHVEVVESHPQALGQCKNFLSKHCGHTKRRDAPSTSQAAANALRDATGATAAIASKLCADLTGLTILAAAIQDDSNNTTRFLILQRKTDIAPELSTPDPAAPERKSKTLVVFTVSHSKPGALAKALAVFSKHDINLTGMHTAPLGEGMWQYVFFVEFQGRYREGGSGKVNEALAELEGNVRWVRWLGSWEDGGGR